MRLISRVLVTGASGFVGRHVVEELHRQRMNAAALMRHPSSEQVTVIQAGGVSVIRANIWKPETLDAALEGIDAVIHLVGIIQPYKENTFERVHAEGTRNLLGKAKAAGSVKKFVHMSALGTRLTARSRYHQTKWQAEELVRRSGLRFTIFRPSIIYGDRSAFLDLLRHLLCIPWITPLVGSGKSLIQPVWAREVAECFVKALTEESTDGQSFDLVGPEPMTFQDMVRTYADSLGKRKIYVHLPLSLMRRIADLQERILAKPPLTRDQLLMIEENNAADPSGMTRLLGRKPTSFSEWLSSLRP